MIKFVFNIEKATQAAAYLLTLNNNRMNYTKLIKLLFIADRRAIEKWNNVITTDTPYILSCGPVGTRIFDEIKNKNNSSDSDYWHSIIEKNNFDVCIKKKPVFDNLSKRELRELQSVYTEFKNFSYGNMIDYCHENFAEWHDPKGSSERIPFEKMIDSIFNTEEEKKDATENLKLAELSQAQRYRLSL